MNLRTFTVNNRDDEQLNAVLVCVFRASANDRCFLAYTLNENLGNQLTRVYLAAVDVESQTLRLSTASTEDYRIATQALKAMCENLGNDEAHHDSYQHVAPGMREVLGGRMEGHHQLRVNQQWLLKLLSPSASAMQTLPEFEKARPASLLKVPAPPAQTLMSSLSAASTDPAMSLNYSFGERQSPSYAQPVAVPVHPSPAEGPDQARLDSLRKFERNIRSVVASLNQKKDALEAHRARLAKLDQQLAQREATLLEREVELQDRDERLSEGFSELAKIDHELDELFRGLGVGAAAPVE